MKESIGESIHNKLHEKENSIFFFIIFSPYLFICLLFIYLFIYLFTKKKDKENFEVKACPMLYLNFYMTFFRKLITFRVILKNMI